jgi:putative nucleotidyltransferase with HDIG domain
VRRSIQPDRLQHRIATLENVPTLSAVAVEMIRLWDAPDLSVREITELLSRDPSLSAKVLQVANSSSLGLKKKVSSINHAAALLGLNALRCITLGVTVFQCFSDHKAEWAERMDLDEFWRHSLAVAVAAEMLAVRFGWPNPEEAFLAGLLHDIGKIGLLAIIPQDYVDVVERASSGQKSLIEYESEELSITHTEVGKRITERWGFPDILRNAVWLHHQLPQAGKLDKNDLPGLIYLADHMARRSRIGASGNQVFFHDDSWLTEKFRFTEQELTEFTGDLLIRTQSIAEKLDLPLPTVEVYLKALEEANQKLSRGGLSADQEHRRSLRTIEVLSTVSEIHQMRVHEDLEVDLLAKAVDLIRQRFALPWMVIMTHDTSLMTLEGVISSDHLGRTQTFYRSVENGDGHDEAHSMSRKGILDLLGETVLSSGKRVNLRDEVCRVLESGQLSAIPIELDQVYRGECLVDTSGSKVVDAETRLSLDTAVEAAFALQERSRLYRRLQREAEDSAEAARREAEAMRQVFHVERLASIGRLAAGAAHEINNPLAVISGKAQILVMDEADAKRSKALQDIVDQTERISKIISDLMGFARPTQPLVADTHLVGLIDGALQMAHHRFPKSQVVPVVDVSPDIPTIRVDARQIEQVLVNLFVNAIQALGERGTLTIRASHLKSTNMISVQVIDNGPGIPGPDLPRIFDPFFTTKREGEGTGLGLAVCQRIIQTHGGHIWVTSHVGKGTAFTIQLPCGSAEEQVQEARPKSILTGKRPTRKRILLVDDERSLSDLIRDFLTSAGYEIDQAMDGEEGMRLLNANVYDGLVIDIRMPRKDGLEVLKELQGTTPVIPSLIITGLATNEEIDQAKDLGVDRVLRKPFQLDELLQAVREITKTA